MTQDSSHSSLLFHFGRLGNPRHLCFTSFFHWQCWGVHNYLCTGRVQRAQSDKVVGSLLFGPVEIAAPGLKFMVMISSRFVRASERCLIARYIFTPCFTFHEVRTEFMEGWTGCFVRIAPSPPSCLPQAPRVWVYI